MRICLPFLLTVFAATGAAFAQKALENIPPPKAPFVAPIPDKKAWTVVADLKPENPAAGQPATAQPSTTRQEASVKYTKTGEITHREATFTTGDTSETWNVGTYYLWKPQGQEPMVNDTAGPHDYYVPEVGHAYPGVSWVSSKTYDHPVTFDQQTCYHYTFGEREAWIACETGLPVAYKEGGILYRYAFLPPPPAQLQLPADYQTAWDAAMKLVQRRAQLKKDLSQ